MPIFGNGKFTTMKRTNQAPFVFGQNFQRRRLNSNTSVTGGIASGSQSSIVYQRPRRKIIRNSFKSKLVSAQPAKHYSYTADQAAVQDTIYTTCPTAGIVQGSTNATRDGDAVYLAALKGRFTYMPPGGVQSFIGRMIIGYSGEEYLGLGTDFGVGLTSAEVFLPGTTTFSTNGIVNPKGFTVLYDETIDVDNVVTSAGTSNSASGSFNVPLDTNFVYQASGSTMGKTKNLYVLFLSVTPGGAVAAPTGTFSVALDLIFK